MSNSVGRPATLDQPFLIQIENLFRKGLKKQDIMKELSIPEGTWSTWYWRNYHGFRDKIQQWERDKMLAKAEENLGENLKMDVKINGRVDAKILKIKTDTSMFVAETLGRTHYAKKLEGDGVPQTLVQVNILNYSGATEMIDKLNPDGTLKEVIISNDNNMSDPIKHNVTQEDLDANPVLVEQGVKLGDEIELPYEGVTIAVEGSEIPAEEKAEKATESEPATEGQEA